MKTAAVYILTLVLLAAVSCAPSHEQATLATAEAVMQQRPDSALALLQTLDSRQLKSDGDRALYALLLSQAYDKNYIDLTDDSLISIAVNHYGGTGDHRHAMLAHYYHGRIHYNAGDYLACILSCLNSEYHALKVSDNFYLGMIYRLISDIYNNSYVFEEAFKYAELSYEYFSQTDQKAHINNAKNSLAYAYHNIGKSKRSLELYQDLITTAEVEQDTMFLCENLSEYAHVLWVLGKYEESRNAILSIINRFHYPLRAVDCGHLAEIYARNGDIDSAKYYITIGNTNAVNGLDRSSLEIGQREIYKQTGDSLNAYKKSVTLYEIQDEILDSVQTQEILAAHRNYYKEKTSDFISKYGKTIFWSATSFAIILILSIILFIFYKRRLNKNKSEIVQYQRQLDGLNLKLHDQIKQNKDYHDENLERIVELNLYREQSHFNEYFRSQADKRVKEATIVMKFINYAKTDTTKIEESDWLELESYVSQQYPLFKEYLLSNDVLTDADKRFCIMTKCGISPAQISRLTHRARSSVSSSKKRIYRKIFMKNGSASDFDLFISEL